MIALSLLFLLIACILSVAICISILIYNWFSDEALTVMYGLAILSFIGSVALNALSVYFV